MSDIFKHNQESWNKESREGGRWSTAVSAEEIKKAKKGEWSIILTPSKSVPKNWFPSKIEDIELLLVGGGGGQQTPIMSAAGAKVTVLDASKEQLKRDQEVCEEYGLPFISHLGDMQNMHQFKDESFDLLINPCSNCFIPDVQALWNECFRVLKPGGRLMAGHVNPTIFAADVDRVEETGEVFFINKIPYQGKDSQTGHWEFGHSLESLIGGQLKAGFHLIDMYEDEWGEEKLDRFMPFNLATLALKPSRQL